MFKNSLYNLAGFILRTGLTFLTVPLLIRLIGIKEYGLWTLVSTILGIVGLAEAGLPVSTTVFLSPEIAQKNRLGISQILTITMSAMLILATLAGLGLWMGSDGIVSLLPNLDLTIKLKVAMTLKWAALVVVAKLLQQVMVGVEQAHQRYDWLNILNTLQILLSTGGMLAIAYLGGKIVALMQWQAIVTVFMLILHGIFAYSLLANYGIGFTWNRERGWTICRYSAATWVSSLGSAIFQQGDRLIVGSVLGTELLGVYGAITTVTTQINVFSAIAIQPLLPKLGELLQQSRDRLEMQIKKAVQANLLLVISLASLILLISPWLTYILFGEYNSQYQQALQLATVAYAVYSLNATGYYTILGLGYAKIAMLITVVSGIFSLLLILLGANVGGIRGSALGNIGYALSLSYMTVAMRTLKIPLSKLLVWISPKEIWLFLLSILKKTNLITT